MQSSISPYFYKGEGMKIVRDRNADARARGGLGLAWRQDRGQSKTTTFVWILIGPLRFRLKWRRR